MAPLARYSVRDPATAEVIEHRDLQSPAMVAEAIAWARDGFHQWSRLPAKDRCQILTGAAQLLLRHHGALARTLTRTQGKPLAEALSEAKKAAAVVTHYADPVLVEGHCPTGQDRPGGSHVSHEPYGVAAAILPNNYPVTLLAYKVAPALAAGCAVVVKPDLQTPRVTEEALGVFHAAGVPPAALRQVYCDDHTAAQALVESPDVPVVSFTGSRLSGQHVLGSAAASETLKRCILELGGVNAMVVEADAPFEASLAAALYKGYRNAGQVCHGISHVYVARPLYQRWLAAFVEGVGAIKTGSGFDPSVVMGPLATEKAQASARQAVDSAREHGATVHQDRASVPAQGSFVPPTVITGTDEAMPVRSMELFGPVVIVEPYLEIDDLIESINRHNAGLVTYLYGGDTARLADHARRIQSGTLGLNAIDVIRPSVPFGGWRNSGLGCELGTEGIRNYQRPRHVRLGST